MTSGTAGQKGVGLPPMTTALKLSWQQRVKAFYRDDGRETAER
jgi:hypothetical protein